MKINIFPFLFILLVSFFLESLANDSPKDINYWCSTTPHPEPCRTFTNLSNQYIPNKLSDFRTLLVQVALKQALQPQTNRKELHQDFQSKWKRAGLINCAKKLYDDTILQLNRTYHGLITKTKTCTDSDAQTWLSTALTNIETCKVGSNEVNVSSFISNFISNNVTDLITNSLAVNEKLVRQQDLKKRYPNWLAKTERKLLQNLSLSLKASYKVAQDGSGNFSSIQTAINFAVSKRVGSGRIFIHVKRGVYTENVLINSSMSKITLVGDGLRYTIITGNRSVSTGFTTYSSATVGVDGPGFMAQGITFRNTAGPQRGQAVALRSASDLSAFYACSFEGYQDTLFVQAQRQFFKMCYISGTIDFIFGNAAVVIQNCNIYVRKPIWGQTNVITAQGRGDPFQNTGISIQYSRVMAAPDLVPVVGAFDTYLGRPWQQFSRTVFLNCYFGSLVHPAGWMAWDDSNFAQTTVYYGEYMNFGPGASLTKRVNWTGYHIIKKATDASQFTVTSLITGQAWLRATGVPYIAGL